MRDRWRDEEKERWYEEVRNETGDDGGTTLSVPQPYRETECQFTWLAAFLGRIPRCSGGKREARMECWRCML